MQTPLTAPLTAHVRSKHPGSQVCVHSGRYCQIPHPWPCANAAMGPTALNRRFGRIRIAGQPYFKSHSKTQEELRILCFAVRLFITRLAPRIVDCAAQRTRFSGPRVNTSAASRRVPGREQGGRVSFQLSLAPNGRRACACCARLTWTWSLRRPRYRLSWLGRGPVENKSTKLRAVSA